MNVKIYNAIQKIAAELRQNPKGEKLLKTYGEAGDWTAFQDTLLKHNQKVLEPLVSESRQRHFDWITKHNGDLNKKPDEFIQPPTFVSRPDNRYKTTREANAFDIARSNVGPYTKPQEFDRILKHIQNEGKANQDYFNKHRVSRFMQGEAAINASAKTLQGLGLSPLQAQKIAYQSFFVH